MVVSIAAIVGKKVGRVGYYGDQDGCQVCRCRRVTGLLEALKVQHVPALLDDLEGPVRLDFQGVVGARLDILCVLHIPAPDPDLLTCKRHKLFNRTRRMTISFP